MTRLSLPSKSFGLVSSVRQTDTNTDPLYSGSTANPDERRKFERLSKSWWHENGPFEALHRFNALRVPWINRTLVNNYIKSEANLVEPLDGLYVLDIGCGGGILSEPLARLGAQVTAIDMVRENIAVAQNRLNSFASGTNDHKIVDRIQYINCKGS